MAYVFLYGVSVSKTSLYKACRNKILGPSGRTRPVCRTDLAQLSNSPSPKASGYPLLSVLYTALSLRIIRSTALHSFQHSSVSGHII